MRSFNVFLYSLLLLSPGLLFSQAHTVGIFVNTDDSQPGYTLFSPIANKTTYLIDECGRQVHTWDSDHIPGNSLYFLEDGDLLRTARIHPTTFSGGGVGGRIERMDWDGNMVWEFEYLDSAYQQHHDVEVLPNGNILMLAFEAKSEAEVLAAGRNPSKLTTQGLWLEHIIEVQPIGKDSGVIVWEWHLWDHLIQDFDNGKDNYGVVIDHPELVDLNFVYAYTQDDEPDWTHCNSVAYNPELDQIMLSCRAFCELWVIDHSTTTAEAASHSGGRSGKGGDLLYRWGNPQAYRRGSPSDQKLFQQHHCHWVPDSMPGGGNIILFNNGEGRRGGDFSSADELIPPPVDSNGNYYLAPGPTAKYGPADFSWQYIAPDSFSMYSHLISGVWRQPNGNTLICSGMVGTFIEVTPAKQVAWHYVSPATDTRILSQGDQLIGNLVFRAHRIPEGHPGLAGRNLTPGVPIELNPIPIIGNCRAIGVEEPLAKPVVEWGPNPVAGVLRVRYGGQEGAGSALNGGAGVGAGGGLSGSGSGSGAGNAGSGARPGRNPLAGYLELVDVQGRVVQRAVLDRGENRIAVGALPVGLYLLRVDGYGVGKMLKVE